jgi:hypothetical protein
MQRRVRAADTDCLFPAVMLFGVFYNRIRYRVGEYLAVLLVSGGIGLFFLSNKVQFWHLKKSL